MENVVKLCIMLDNEYYHTPVNNRQCLLYSDVNICQPSKRELAKDETDKRNDGRKPQSR